MKLYIAGPMTGLPEFNYPAFFAAEKQLAAHGYEVGNPASIGQQDGWEWHDYMRAALRIMLGCDGVALLPGWTESRGAWIEARLAEDLGMRLWHVDQWGVNGSHALAAKVLDHSREHEPERREDAN